MGAKIKKLAFMTASKTIVIEVRGWRRGTSLWPRLLDCVDFIVVS